MNWIYPPHARECCRNTGCCAWPPACNPPVCQARFTLSFCKVNSISKTPLGGAMFELTQGCRSLGFAVSDRGGHVFFRDLLPGRYRLMEVRPPCGFRQNFIGYNVIVFEDGFITIDGLCASSFVIGNEPI